ncbi:unnamed protein product, partial [Chrysoparadoxa australica]
VAVGYTKGSIPSLNHDSSGDRDFVVVVLDATTEEVLWSGIQSSPVLDTVTSVAFSPLGDLVTLGCVTEGSSLGVEAVGEEDAMALTLDASNGNFVWSSHFGSLGEDMVSSVVYAPDRSFVAVAGYMDAPGAGADQVEEVSSNFWAAALDYDSGTELWRWTKGISSEDIILATAVAPDSLSMLVGGKTSGTFAGSPRNRGPPDMAAIMLDSQGNQLWTWQGGTLEEDAIQAAAFHPDGSMVVVGGFTDGNYNGRSNGDRDMVAVALNTSDGKPLWTWQGGSDALDTVTGVAYAPDGEFVVLCGSTLSSMQGNPSAGVAPAVAIALESSSGDVLWTWEGQFGGSSPVSWVNDCALAPGGGKLFMAGYSSSSWLNPYNAPANANLAVVALTGPTLGPEPLPPAGPAPATPTVEMATAILGEKVNSFVEEEEAAFLAAVTSLG